MRGARGRRAALRRGLTLLVVLTLLGLLVPDAGRGPTYSALVKVERASGLDTDPGVVWILALGSDARPGESPAADGAQRRTRGGASPVPRGHPVADARPAGWDVMGPESDLPDRFPGVLLRDDERVPDAVHDALVLTGEPLPALLLVGVPGKGRHHRDAGVAGRLADQRRVLPAGTAQDERRSAQHG